MRLVTTILVLPLGFIFRITQSESFFVFCGQALALLPGEVGSYIRVSYYRLTLNKCSKDSHIGFGSYFSHPEAEVWEGVYIGAYCVLGMVRIGNHATIGSGVYIMSGKRQHGYVEIGKPIQEQPGKFTVVTIGENTWIGNCAVILADIGSQSVIGAGSVITNNTNDFEVLAGNPARVIRRLSDIR